MSAADLTQEEAYNLYYTYGGALDEKAQSQVNHLLAEMSYPEEPIGNVRAEVGDRLYFPAVRALEALQAREAAGAAPCPPRAPTSYRTRGERASEAEADMLITALQRKGK